MFQFIHYSQVYLPALMIKDFKTYVESITLMSIWL